jgi:hypothetical protein
MWLHGKCIIYKRMKFVCIAPFLAFLVSTVGKFMVEGQVLGQVFVTCFGAVDTGQVEPYHRSVLLNVYRKPQNCVSGRR